VKAGLSRDAWKDSGTRTFAFTTEVFTEASCR
jgi:AMMECR1 domain-containing protein